MLIEFKTLGGLRLRGPLGSDCDSILSQPKRLALLAYLTLAHRGEHARRDTILPLFWPDLDDHHARGALRQSVRFLRRTLGDRVLISHGSGDIAVDSDALWCDAIAFDRACDADDWTAASELYQGDLLHGLYVSDASPGLERWIEDERARIRRRASKALWRVVDASEEEGNIELAAERARRALGFLPDDEVGVRRLVTLLNRLGDREGAVRAYQTFARHLEAEYEVAPAAETTALIATVRSHPQPESTPPSASRVAFASVGGAAATLSHARVHQQVLEDKLGVAPNPALTEFVNPLRGRRESRLDNWRVLLQAGVVLLVVAFLIVGGIRRDRTGALADRSDALGTDRIVVLPFRVASRDSSVVHLREGMVHLLAQRLTGEGGPVAVDPAEALSLAAEVAPGTTTVATGDAFRIARQSRAREVLLGEIVTTAQGRVLLSGTIISVLNGRALGRTSAEGSPDSLPHLADRLVADLLAQRAGEPETRRSALRAANLSAVRAFLAGRAAHRRGDDDAAIAAFGRALAADSTFGLAGLELASAMGWVFRWTTRLESTMSRGVRLGSGVRMAGDEEMWIRAVDLAWRGRERMSAGDVAYLSALRGQHYPRASSAREALADWERVVQVEPKRAEVWTRLGQVLFQQGFALGLNDAHLRAAAIFRRARELDPEYMRAVAWLLELAARSGNTAEVRHLTTVYLSHDSVSRDADFLRWRAAAAVGDMPALASLRQRFDSLDSQTLEWIQWSSQVNGVSIEDAERTMSILVRRAGERRERWISLWRAQLLALNSGRPRAALQLADAKRQVEPDSGLFRWYNIVHAMYGSGDSVAGADAARLLERDASAAVASGRARSGTRGAYQELSVAIQWRLWRGDTTGAAQTIRNIRRFSSQHSDPQLTQSADILEAILAAVSHRADAPALLERVDSIALQGCCDTPHYIGLVVARLRERAGDRVGALRAIRRGRWLYPPQHLSTFLREEGRLAALTGDRRGGIEAYRHWLALRENPEPALRPERDSIRLELATLEGTTPKR